MKLPTVYLSRRNLLSLLSKLDRKQNGEDTKCTIIKHKQLTPNDFNQSMNEIAVVAVEDDVYYEAQKRSPGELHPRDEKQVHVLGSEARHSVYLF